MIFDSLFIGLGYMSRSLNITIAQTNFTVGAIENNLSKIISIYHQITQTTNLIIPDLLVFSELCITGYPAEDLYLQSNFQRQAESALNKLKSITKNHSCAILVGNIGVGSTNAAYLIANGNIKHVSSKINLPNYDVFDEQRYFIKDQHSEIFELNGYKIGVLICEDLWHPEISNKLCQQNAEILIAINASPFSIGKDRKRKAIVENICQQNKVDLVYVNQVGGQDELIFDGGSFVCNANGEIVIQLDYFVEMQKNISFTRHPWQAPSADRGSQESSLISTEAEMIYKALVLGLYDYVHKKGFNKILLGLSGGIDSALTAAIAVDALGAENVVAVMLPSQYTSKESLTDAKDLAAMLKIELLNIPIEQMLEMSRLTLSGTINFKEGEITDQNIQARLRGMILMALSNKLGHLLLSTGNKSENAVGYATLYGDMCGGYNPLKDLYKTQVFTLSKWRKLPKSIIDKAPSAELHFNQKDQDNLPEYELLDQILFNLIEKNLSIDEVSAKGYDHQLVTMIFNLLNKAEYKRRQSCPGPIISTCSLSKGRRYPILG